MFQCEYMLPSPENQAAATLDFRTLDFRSCNGVLLADDRPIENNPAHSCPGARNHLQHGTDIGNQRRDPVTGLRHHKRRCEVFHMEASSHDGC